MTPLVIILGCLLVLAICTIIVLAGALFDVQEAAKYWQLRCAETHEKYINEQKKNLLEVS